MRWREVSLTGFIVSELIYGLIYSVIVFIVSLAIGEYGVWVFLQWMLEPEKIYRYFYMVIGIVSALFCVVPIYNRRFVQLLGVILFLMIFWLLLTRRFGFDPVTTFFG